MHDSSMEEMTYFFSNHLNKDRTYTILDVGSQSHHNHPTYKDLIGFNSLWTYTGGDVEEGPNVDLVFKDPYIWVEEDQQFDVVISGQCLEHVENSHAWMVALKHALKPEGICCIIAPHTFPEHRYPLDCYRFMPDGMRFLLRDIAGLNVIEIRKNNIDCIGIAKKNG